MPPPSKRPQAHWLAIAGLFLATIFLHSELAALRALPQRRGLHGVERDDTAAMPPPLEGDLEQLVEERVDRKLSVVDERMEQLVEERVDRKLSAVDERMEQLVEERVDRKLSAVDERIGTLEAQVERLSRAGKGDRRRTQRTGAVGGEAARIIIRNTAPAPSTHGGRGGRGRRAQSVGTCAAADISSRTQAITAACCDDPSAGCSGGGTPQTCNAECAGIFLPFWDECQSALGKARRVFEPVVVMCEAVENETPSLAMQLGVTCTDGTSTDDCVPTCNEDIHGFLLLLNINGNDNKLSCELQHGLYSWVGSSTDGGYLGPDIQTFFSAVTSGAAGVYVGTLVEDAGVSTAMVVTAGQSISISGDPSLEEAPQWALASDDTCYGANNGYCNDGSSGDGGGCPLGTDATDCGTPPNDSGFVVQAHGYLFLSYIALGGAPVMLNVGGSLSLTSMIVPEAALIQAMSAVHGVGSEGSALRLTDVSVLEARSDDTCMDWGGRWGRGRLSDNGFCEDGGPNQDPNAPAGVDCTRGTDMTDCDTPPSTPVTYYDTVGVDGIRVSEGTFAWGRPVFSVSSGPCTVSEGGGCVGRPEGYGPNENCAIETVGGGGMLGQCGVFETESNWDFITLPDRSTRFGSDCPVGVALAPSASVEWHSDVSQQGSGWQICFA